METSWGPAATVLAAVIGGSILLIQQARHWREARRDKVRDAYAEWMGALARSRRSEEQLLMFTILAQEEVRRRAEAGDQVARHGGVELTEEGIHRMQVIQRDIEAGNRELDVTFSKVCLLDRDWRRIKAAEVVRGMPTLMTIQAGEVPSEEAFNERWLAKSRAVGEMADLINRTLALEGLPSFRWDAAERRLEERQADLHARMRADRLGRPKREGA